MTAIAVIAALSLAAGCGSSGGGHAAILNGTGTGGTGGNGGNGGTSGGGGTGQSTRVKVDVDWPTRSRVVTAPSSGLSMKLIIPGGVGEGGDLAFCSNRNADPAAHRESYQSTATITAGPWQVRVQFFARADCFGDVTATASVAATIKADGTGIPDITPTGLIAAVTVPDGQTVAVGQTADLTFTATDAANKVIAVSPGSATITVQSGADKVQVVAGQIKGIAPGTATVTVTVDGKTSAPATVTVPGGTTLRYSFENVDQELTDLFGATASGARAVNAGGVCVGYFTTPDGKMHGFVRSAAATAVYVDMGPDTELNDINTAQATVGRQGDHATLWPAGGGTDLGTLPGDTTSVAASINDSGQVVGTSTGAHPTAFVWQNGTMKALPPLPGGNASSALSINRNGQIVGWSTDAGGVQRAVRWTLTNTTNLEGLITVSGLGSTPGETSSQAIAISDNAVIVGTAVTGNGTTTVGFVWNGTGRVPLGSAATVPVAIPYGINSIGDAVGQRDNAVGLWPSDNRTGISLNDRIAFGSGATGANGNQARDINDAGTIVGNATTQTNLSRPRAFLLKRL
jgi:probable HAF family extracellular repeat protein